MSGMSPSEVAPDGAVGDGRPRGRGRWLLLARAGWVLVALATVGLDLYAIPTLYHEAFTPCPDRGPCGDAQFTVSKLAQLHAHGISTGMVATFNVVVQTAAMLIFAAVAAVIFWRRSDDRMALFAAYMLVTFGGAGFNGAVQALPDVNRAWFVPAMTLNVIGQVLFVTFFFVFPDGRFVPRWTRWVALLTALVWLTAYFPGSAVNSVFDTFINGPLFVAVMLALVIAQVYRYRRVSTARQRQQTKWVVFGFAIGLGIFALLIVMGNDVLPAAATSNAIGELLFTAASYLLLTLIPVAIGIAILRSRLYDIDVLINRTLVYGPVTATLAAVYLGSVVGLQAVGAALTGQSGDQPAAIVISTLVIAALFQPLRARLQRFIDRRFYRSRYNAARTLAGFGQALRQEVDLPALEDRLLATVEETMRPAHMSLWLETRARTAGAELRGEDVPDVRSAGKGLER